MRELLFSKKTVTTSVLLLTVFFVYGCDGGGGGGGGRANPPVCGDNIVNGIEQCDDGNADNTDACLDTCVAATCGDGFTQVGIEACDDGNADNTDACLDTCVAATCGDGFTQAGVEGCDDGNLIDGDGCEDDCTLTPLPPQAAIISGSVSGTMVLAVNQDGEVLAKDSTTGRTSDVDRDNNGINESFSFTLTGIPLNTAIRIYLISEGQIYPMYFDSSGGNGLPDTNVLFISATSEINLGFIDTNNEGNTGRAIPQINPVSLALVGSGLADPDIPREIITPVTAGLSVNELIDSGFESMVNGAALMARTYFVTAVANSNAQTNLGDAARFFYAVTRVGAVVFETYSDGDATDMNQVGDVLDGFAVNKSDEIRANFEAIEMKIDEIINWPDNSPTGTDIQNLIRNTLKAELEGAIGNLDEVSDTFSWLEVLPDSSPIEFDYGDSLAVRAAFKTILAILQFQDSYDLGADIDAVANNRPTTTIQSFLLDNPKFLTLGTSKLDSVKANTRSALVDIDKTITEIQGETDLQEDDLLSFIDILPEDVAAFQADILSAINDLDAGSVLASLGEMEMSPPPGAPSEITVDLYGLFGGIDLRSKLPAFSGDRPGFFPDDTLGGLIVGGTEYLNYDEPSDGKPDILQRNQITGEWNIRGKITFIHQ